MLDESFARHLHVQSLRHRDLHPEHEPHVLFQASTIGALLDGAYDGDVTFAELAEHGDLGLGTLNALDGEMIAIDGHFYRADIDGSIEEIDPAERTPFAALAWFEPRSNVIWGARSSTRRCCASSTRSPLTGTPPARCASTAEFDHVRARSVPRQLPPYRPLAEVVAEQHVFELRDVAGTMVGFRFPAYAEGLEVGGYHLHFITAERDSGGHVLDSRLREGVAQVDLASDLHVELPPGIEVHSPRLDEQTRDAIERAERQG